MRGRILNWDVISILIPVLFLIRMMWIVMSVYDLKTIDRVYTIGGRLIMLDGQDNFGSLPSGIYIVNGRKIAIP